MAKISMPHDEKTRTPAPLLAAELIDCILEYLQCTSLEKSARWRPRLVTEDSHDAQGKRDLFACSLVCRAWSSAARPHIFRDVAFVVRAPHRQRGKEAYKTFVDYDQFLRSFPAAAASIRRLHLEFPDQYRNSLTYQHLYPEALALFLSRMPMLERLHLRNVHISRIPDPAENLPRSYLQELQLEYNSGGPDPNNAIIDGTESLLASGLFARAETLHLASLSIRRDSHLSCSHPEILQELVVNRLIIERAHTGPDIFAVICGTRSLQGIRAMEIRILTELDADGEMVKSPLFTDLIAPSLEHLTVRLVRPQAAYGRNVVDITSLANLRTLSLSFTMGSGIYPSLHAANHFLRSFPLQQLSRACHPRLEEVHIVITVDPRPAVGETTRYRLEELQTRLDDVDRRLVETIKRCGLRCVSIEYEVERRDANAQVLMETLFPVSRSEFPSVVCVQVQQRPGSIML